MAEEHSDVLAAANRVDGKRVKRRMRQKQFNVRMTEAEYARFCCLQADCSMSGAGMIRRWVMGQRVHSTIDLQAVNELRRQGGLLKHTASLLLSKNQDRALVSELFSCAKQVLLIAEEVRDGIKKNQED